MAAPVRTRFVWSLLWLLGGLPWPVLRWLGALLGHTVRLLGLREARVARRSIALCLPQLDDDGQERLCRQNLVATGQTLTETLRLWTRQAADNLRLVRETEGVELLDAALERGEGVIIAAPHLGNWELLNQWLATRSPLAIVYRPPRHAWADTLIRRARAQPGVTQVRAEAAGVRTLFRTLQGGGMIGILPDQQPKRGDGEFAPFFGIPALTMTLLPRLAQRSGATVLMAFAERLADGGFRIHILPAPAALSDPDPARATAALNAAVEQCILLAPAQYQWSYKRFTIRPEGDAPIRYD